MSLDALVWVLHNSPTRGSEKLVLLGLADAANAEGADAWPTVEELGVWAGVDRRRTQRILRTLEDAGLIKREGTARTDPRYRPNSYTVVGVTPLIRRGPGAGRSEGESRGETRGGREDAPDDPGAVYRTPRGGLQVPPGAVVGPPKQSLVQSVNNSPPTPSTRRVRFPAEWTPGDAEKEAAERVGMTVATRRHQWDQFRDHHLAKGSLMVDWLAAWRTWCRNWHSYGAQQSVSHPSAGNGDQESGYGCGICGQRRDMDYVCDLDACPFMASKDAALLYGPETVESNENFGKVLQLRAGHHIDEVS